MSLNMIEFLILLLAQTNPGSAPDEAKAITSLKRANEQLRLNTCAAVGEAERLLNEARIASGSAKDSKYGELAARRIARKRESLECKAEQQPNSEPETKKPEGKKARVKAAGPAIPAPPPAAKTTAPKATEKAKAIPAAASAAPGSVNKAQTILRDYRAVREIASDLAQKCKLLSAVSRPPCLAELHLARDLQADLALDALCALSERDSEWASVRKDLLVIWSGDQRMQDFLKQMQEKLASGDVSEAEAQAALDTPHDKFTLAVALSRAGGSADVWNAFVQRVQGVLPEESRRTLDANRPVDWVAVFAHLQNLSDEKWEMLKARMEGMRIWDPHPRSDQIGLLYMVAEPKLAEAAAPFLNAFTPWMQRLSPQGASDPETWKGRYETGDVDRMLRAAQTELSRKESSTCLRQALPQKTTIEGFLDWFLCGSRAGLVVVELSREGNGIKATASWVVRVGGQQASFDSRGTSTTFPEAVSAQATGDIQIAQTDAGHQFAELLIFQKGVFPHLVELIAQVEKLKCHKCEETTGTAWHAFLFAGLPYLEDSKSGTGARLIASGLDVATLFGSLAAMRWSIHERNRYSTGSEHAFGDANDYLKTSGYLLLGTLAVRSAAAICYWSDACRRWTRR